MLNGHDFLIISCDGCHIKALWHLVNNDGMVTHDWDIIVNILENWRWRFKSNIALFANGKAGTIKEGVELARQLIADGSALEKLRKLQEVQV